MSTKMTTFQQILEGMKIFETYTSAKSPGSIAAEHDEIYVTGAHRDAVGGDDRKKLKSMSWSWDDKFDAWHHFV